jgi:uncharacterized protein YbaA (DUF1428 family)
MTPTLFRDIIVSAKRALRGRHAGAAILIFADFGSIRVLKSQCCDQPGSLVRKFLRAIAARPVSR